MQTRLVYSDNGGIYTSPLVESCTLAHMFQDLVNDGEWPFFVDATPPEGEPHGDPILVSYSEEDGLWNWDVYYVSEESA